MNPSSTMVTMYHGTSESSTGPLARRGRALAQPVARLAVEVEPVDLLQAADPLQARLAERHLAVERVQDDAFEQVAEGDVVELGQSLEDFQEALFHPDAGLDALDFDRIVVRHEG